MSDKENRVMRASSKIVANADETREFDDEPFNNLIDDRRGDDAPVIERPSPGALNHR